LGGWRGEKDPTAGPQCGVAALVRRAAPRWAWERSELLTVYVALVIGSCIGGHDQLQILFTTLTYVFRGATPANESVLCGCRMYIEPSPSLVQTTWPVSASRAWMKMPMNGQMLAAK
jgi:hypothetical protein